MYQLFKGKKKQNPLSIRPIKGCENVLLCVVKPIIANHSVADGKKVRNVLQSVGAMSRVVARKINITHSTVLRILKKK
jgi:hypothetical protein